MIEVLLLLFHSLCCQPNPCNFRCYQKAVLETAAIGNTCTEAVFKTHVVEVTVVGKIDLAHLGG